MARVLLGWELGSGRGHVQSMLAISNALAARGHEVALAVQRMDAALGLPPQIPLFQSPIWPRMMLSAEPKNTLPVVTLIDILARLGLDQPGVLGSMIRAWDGIMGSFAPDVVITDFAPALLFAAHGRVPTVSVGPGFQVPPQDAPSMARLGGSSPSYDEAMVLERSNAELLGAGRPAVPTLPALFRVDRPLIASFPELDPYGPRAGDPTYIAPASGEWTPPAAEPGSEIFVYANGPVQHMDVLWHGLALTGVPVRAHLPGASSELLSQVARFGVTVETQPIPWPLIAARSRIGVNHGAHGIMCGLMLAGMPQFALPLDLEKRLHSRAMARAGFGNLFEGETLTANTLAAAVRAVYDDEACLARTRAAAPGFAAQVTVPYGEAVVDVIESLI